MEEKGNLSEGGRQGRNRGGSPFHRIARRQKQCCLRRLRRTTRVTAFAPVNKVTPQEGLYPLIWIVALITVAIHLGLLNLNARAYQ